MFSAIRVGVDRLGERRCRPARCASAARPGPGCWPVPLGDRPTIAGSASSSPPLAQRRPRPRSRSRAAVQNARTSSWVRYGCDLDLVDRRARPRSPRCSRRRCWGWKLDTPIARARGRCAVELLQRPPGLHEVAAVPGRQRPVDQEQVDVLGAQSVLELSRRTAWRASSGRVRSSLPSLLVTKTSPRARPDLATASPTSASLPVRLAPCRCAGSLARKRRAHRLGGRRPSARPGRPRSRTAGWSDHCSA